MYRNPYSHNFIFQVHLSFLYVGHTHEDIDAYFSRIAETLRRKEAIRMPQLLSTLPHTTEITYQWDVSSWLKPYITDIRRHTKPLHYKFLRNDNGGVDVLYKGNQDRPWQNLGKSLFDPRGQGQPTLPQGKPNLVEPDFANLHIDRLGNAVRHWEPLFTTQDIEWWNNYVDDMKKISSCQERRRQYAGRSAVWLLPRLPRQRDQPPEAEESALPPSVSALLAAEVQDPEVQVVRRQEATHQQRQPQPPRRNRQRKPPQRPAPSQRTIFLSYVYMYDTSDLNKHYILLNILWILDDIFWLISLSYALLLCILCLNLLFYIQMWHTQIVQLGAYVAVVNIGFISEVTQMRGGESIIVMCNKLCRLQYKFDDCL